MSKIVLVAACALVDADGRVLIAQRPAGKPMAGLWEFPGGKIEDGEAPEHSLIRELQEELGIDALVGPELARYEQSTGGRAPLVLLFFRVDAFMGEPRAAAFEQILWEEPRELPKYDFLDGDLDFVRRLARGGIPA